MLDNVLTFASSDLMNHVLPYRIIHDPLFSICGVDFYLTNHIVMTIVVAIVLILVFGRFASRIRCGSGVDKYVTKGRVPQILEVICEYLREEVARPALGKMTDKYISFVWTTFFFILFCNLLGMIPVGAIARLVTGDPHAAHWGGAATGNISITAGLAVVAFFMIHIVGIREQRWRYFLHFNPGPGFMAPLLVPLEVVGALVKPFALCVRLFANMVAGHLVLAALIGLIFMAGAASEIVGYTVVLPALAAATALSLLELFVAFLQAYIFTFLTVLFIAAGAVHHNDHEEDDKHGVAEGAV